MAEEKRVRITTPECRLSYPRLFEPWPATRKIDPGKYTASLLFPKEKDAQWAPLREAIKAMILQTWGKLPPKGRMQPIFDGDEESDPIYHDHFFFRVKSKLKPNVVYVERVNGVLQYVRAVDPQMFYPGCWVKIVTHPFAYRGETGSGISLSLNSVLFVRDDDPFVTMGDPNEDFGPPPETGGEVSEREVPF